MTVTLLSEDKMLRQCYSVLAIVALAPIALSACGGSEPPPPTPTKTPVPYITPAPFNPTVPAAPVAEPLAADGSITVENAAFQVVPPGDCLLAENLSEPNRHGSVRAYDYKLGVGFGCPSADGDLRLQEVQFHTAASAAAYDSLCASGECDSTRITAADFDAQRAAFQSGQSAPGWSLVNLAGRSVLVRADPVPDAPASLRRYAEFCGDVRVENWVVMLNPDPDALQANADGLYASVALTCQSQ